MTWMVIRLILSLAFVGAVLWFAARVAKRRGLGQAGNLIEVVARQRMGRSSTVNVLRIGEVVLVVGATEEQVTLLADGEHQATFALQVQLPSARGSGGGTGASLDLLRHVAMEVTVEIGRTRMTVQELLSLHPGEVVELDRAASAPADLLVNGTLIARGEVVVVDEDFGLRISEIVTDAAELGQQSA